MTSGNSRKSTNTLALIYWVAFVVTTLEGLEFE